MKERSKNPSSIVYWNDLANDDELKTCSRAARGLWTTELLPMAAASTEPGVVQIGTRPCVWDGDLPGLLANKGGGTAGEVLELLTDLCKAAPPALTIAAGFSTGAWCARRKNGGRNRAQESSACRVAGETTPITDP